MTDPLGTAPPPPPITTPPGGPLNQEERTWGMACHLSAIVGVAIPFGHVIGPLVVWLIKKDTMPFVDDQGKESLNFQITMTIALLLSAILIIAVIGLALLPVVALVDVILAIMAAIKANEGIAYRYPFNIRFIQ